MEMPAPSRTLFDKIGYARSVRRAVGKAALIYVDSHLIHAAVSPCAFSELKDDGRKDRRSSLVLAIVDDSTLAADCALPLLDDVGKTQWIALSRNYKRSGTALMIGQGPVGK
jgi:homoaconitase/3-isopropylmalate dehydratase large subunit